MRGHQWVARLAAVSVAVGAAVGSTTALLAIGRAADMTWAPALPLSLDGLALVAVMVIRLRGNYGPAWVALVAAAGTSATVQWMTAPPGLVNHLAHICPAPAALWAFELFLRAVSPTVDPAPGLTLPEADRKEVPPGLDVVPAADQPPRISVAGRPAPVDVASLLPVAAEVVAELGRVPGRPTLQRELRARGHALGTAKAETLLILLREETPA